MRPLAFSRKTQLPKELNDEKDQHPRSHAVVFWVVYGLLQRLRCTAPCPAAAGVPVLLGSTGALLVAASFVLLWRVPFRAPSDAFVRLAPKDSAARR